MQDLGAHVRGRWYNPDLPVHRRFQCVLDRKRAAFDEKITARKMRRQPRHPGKRFDELGVAFRINIRVCRLNGSGFSDRLLLNRGVGGGDRSLPAWSRRTRRNQSAGNRSRHLQIETATSFVIQNDPKTVEQDMLLKDFQGVGGPALTFGVGGFAHDAAAPLRWTGRLREHGRDIPIR